MAKTDKNLQKLAKTDHNSGTIEIWVMYVSTDCGNSKSTLLKIEARVIAFQPTKVGQIIKYMLKN